MKAITTDKPPWRQRAEAYLKKLLSPPYRLVLVSFLFSMIIPLVWTLSPRLIYTLLYSGAFPIFSISTILLALVIIFGIIIKRRHLSRQQTTKKVQYCMIE